ncbi:MAG: hypothetical protein LBJ90_00700, partial [Treponema sp.]|nr:hypothetical protein [Treponema sp.]
VDELNRAGREEAREMLRERADAILADPGIPLEDKARTVFDEAGRALLQAAEADPGENPVEYLKARARLLGTTAERNRITGQLDELARIYPPEANKYLAPNGKPSNLNHAQWYAVRTPSFKEWFGDWERLEMIAQLENTTPERIQAGDPINQKAAEDIARSFKALKNVDGRIAELPVNTIGKLFGHKNYDFSRIIESIPGLYETAVLGWSEPEIMKEGHKPHPNIKAYHHYLNKFTDGSGEYFIRITVNEEKAKPGKTGKNLVHSAAISDIAIYKKGDHSQRIRVISPGEASPSPFIDSKLVQFFESVNPSEVSQIRDANGEPLAVYHGTEKDELSVFNTGEHTGYAGRKQSGAFFSADKEYANSYGENLTAAFLNIKNPLVTTEYSDISMLNDDRINSLRGKYDGVVFNDIADGTPYAPKEDSLFSEIAVFSPAQIKSATDNAGTFSGDNPSILFQDGDRDMMEEAAEFKNGKEYRAFVEFMYNGSIPGYEAETAGLSDAAVNAWYDEFVKKAKLAAKSGEQGGGTSPGGNLAPADIDLEFNGLIGEKGKLDEFVKRLTDTHNENYDNWQAVDEEDEAERGRQMENTGTLRRKLTHPTWQSVFKANGDIGPIQRKQLLTLIRRAPRDYRAIYADVMERPEFAVSAEDTTAAALKYRITDSRREDIDSLSPEKLRQLAEQLDIEDYAEKVRTGRALYNDPAERAYIKQLQDQIKEIEQTLKETGADRQEDNAYLERIAGRQFVETLDRAVAAREEIRRSKDSLDKAIAAQKKDARVFIYKAQRATANYNSIVQTLESLAKARKLELNVRDTLENQRVHDAVQAARKELKTESREKIDALKDEVKKVRARERTKASLQKKFAVIMAVKELKAYQEDLKERQKNQKEHTRAKNAVVKRIFRPVNPREVNAEQGRAAAIIQRFAEPSMLEGIDRFIGGIEKPYLRTIFETWKIDEILRAGIVKDKTRATREKMTRLFGKESFDHLTNEERKYLYRVIPPKDWATALGLESIIDRRNENYPATNGQAEQQTAFKYLPPDVYYRILDKPFSEWTLEEGEELAKIIDDLIVRGKEIYKANVDAERIRIKEYQRAVVRTISTIKDRGLQDSPGDSPEERARKKAGREKILSKFDEGIGGTAQARARRRRFKGPLFGYADMNMYHYARMLDNGDANGKNSAVLYRGAADAYNAKMAAIDARTERIEKVMNEQKITKTELWEKTVEFDFKMDSGKSALTAAELIGFLSAARDEYSREAVIYGNLLSEQERGFYQNDEMTMAELAPLYELAEGRFEQVRKAAEQLIADNPKYRQLMDAVNADFSEGGQRLSEALVRYNNSYMPIVDNYFMMIREAPVTVQSADKDLAKDLMGASSGAFNLFVERGFTNQRKSIPPQYQTAIKLDILGVWTEAVSREEHFMAYGQLVKDLNAIYKGNRQVTDAIQRRYGQNAVDYINKYINELANPNPERVRSQFDKAIKAMRGNTAAAYLGWKVSSIVKQFITSPAPFFGYMNPLEYWGAFAEFITHKEESWKEITGLSEHMKHRSANLLTDLVKEQAKQRFENKVDAAISKINERGIKGLEWIDRMCVAPGWLVLYRKELRRLTSGNTGVTLTERDARVKAAEYADDIIRATQPSARPEDIAPLFKGNSELGKAFLQFTQSLNIIWQNIRYDVPQMIRDRRYNNAAGMIMGYVLAGIMLGAVTEWFDDDDDEKERAKKIAKWATLQFTDSFPIIGGEATQLAELLITGKMKYRGGLNLIPAFQKIRYAGEGMIKGIHEKD